MSASDNLGKQWEQPTIPKLGMPVPEGTLQRRSGGVGHLKGDRSRSITAMLPISEVKKYKEVDREGEHAYPSSKETIESIANELKSGGVIKEPLMLEHSTKHQWGYLGEGHHRLAAAELAGHSHVPVFVYSGASGWGPGERKKRGIGAPLTFNQEGRKIMGGTEGVGKDYQPEEMHPHLFKEFE
jgi:hypothetical protein